MPYCGLMWYYQSFLTAIPLYRAGYPRVTHPSATKFRITRFHLNSVRLACVRHAASVHPEPGSNSHVKSLILCFLKINVNFVCFLKSLRVVFIRFLNNSDSECFHSSCSLLNEIYLEFSRLFHY